MPMILTQSFGVEGPRMLLYANGLAVNVGDCVIPAQWVDGLGTGTPGDGTAISAYHVTTAGTLGAEPGSNWPGSASNTSVNCGTAVLLSRNLYHFDPSAPSDGTGSQLSPIKLAASATGLATNGRVCLVRKGTTTAASVSFGASGSRSNKTFGWVVPYAVSSADILTPVFHEFGIGNCEAVVVDGIRAIGTGTSNGVSYTQGASVACQDVFFRNIFPENISGDLANCDGFAVFCPSGNLPIISLFLENVRAFNCGGYGIGFEAATNGEDTDGIELYNVSAIGCGFSKAAWGIGGYPPFNEVSGAVFTRDGGVGTTVYSTAETGSVKRVQLHGGGGVDYRHYAKTAGTASAPLDFEWGQAGGRLYVNYGADVGATLTGKTLRWSYGFLDNIKVTKGFAQATFKAGSADGAGFGADLLTKGWRFEQCLSNYNQGAGFVGNGCETVTFFACIGTDNGSGTGEANFAVYNVKTATLQHIDAYRGAKTPGGAGGDGVGGVNPNGTIILQNSIMKDNAGFGLNINGNVLRNNNAWWNNTGGNINGGTPTPVVDFTGEVSISSGYTPSNPEIVSGGISLGGFDYNGNPFSATPTMGAIQVDPTSATFVAVFARQKIGADHLFLRQSSVTVLGPQNRSTDISAQIGVSTSLGGFKTLSLGGGITLSVEGGAGVGVGRTTNINAQVGVSTSVSYSTPTNRSTDVDAQVGVSTSVGHFREAFTDIDAQVAVSSSNTYTATLVNVNNTDIAAIVAALVPALVPAVVAAIDARETEPGTGVTHLDVERAVAATLAADTIAPPDPAQSATFGFRAAGNAAKTRVSGLTDSRGRRKDVLIDKT